MANEQSPAGSTLITASMILARLLTVDGAGSGLDADLLDGQSSAYYVNTATVQTIGGAKTFSSAVVIGTDPTGAQILRVGGDIKASNVLATSSAANASIAALSTSTTGFSFGDYQNDVGATFQAGTLGSARAGTTFGLANANLCTLYTAQYGGTSPSGLAIGTNSNIPIVFGTNAVARMTISGNPGDVTFHSTTAATSSIVGAVLIGNGTAATNVGIGGGAIYAGAILGVADTSTRLQIKVPSLTEAATSQNFSRILLTDGGAGDIFGGAAGHIVIMPRTATTARHFSVWTGLTTAVEKFRVDGSGVVSFYDTTTSAAVLLDGGMQIATSKNLRMGTAAVATSATDGFLYLSSCAGTPVGTPTTLTGTAPAVIDTTNNLLYFYSTGAWRQASTNLLPLTNTWTAANTIAPSSAVVPLTITQGTITTDLNALSMTSTWNAGGVTFTGIKANTTITSCSNVSLLMDLQTGGTSRFNVGWRGNVVIAPATTVAATNALTITQGALTNAVTCINATATWNAAGGIFHGISLDVTDTSSGSASTFFRLLSSSTEVFSVNKVGEITITRGTVTNTAPLISATSTWNNGATSFIGWQLNVTNTASASTSRLLNILVGSADRFNVRVDGLTTVNQVDSTTTTSNLAFSVQALTTGTAAAGFGGRLGVSAHVSNGNIQGQIGYEGSWVDATEASRKARGKLTAYDTAARECLRIEASGTAAMIGFLGAAAVVRPSLAAPTGTTTRTTYDTTTVTVAQLAERVKAIIEDLRAYGLEG